MRLSDMRAFCSGLATMLESGIPIRESLDHLSRGPRHPIAALSGRLLHRIDAGDKLADALRREVGAFPHEFIAVIEAGERSGKVPKLLAHLAVEAERRQEAKRKIALKLAYPVLILVLLALVTPLYLLVQGETGAYLLVEALVFLPAIALAAGGFFLARSIRAGSAWSRRLEGLLLALPLAGPAFHRLSLGRSFSLLGLLLQSGISFREALTLASRAVRFQSLKDGFRRVEESIAAGKDFGSSLAAVAGIPDQQRLAITSGERAGKLDQALIEAGDRVVESAWRKLDVLTACIPVAVYLIAGAAVLAVLLKLFGKIYPSI